LEAYAHTQLVVLGLKTITGRERPSENDEDGSFWEGGNSFPSGHAATSFALATVFAYEYRKHIAVPIAAYSVATAITISRTSAQRHWASDVVVGASIGFLIGRYVVKNHQNPSGSDAGSRSRLIPAVGFGAGGAVLTWSFD
jgi:membrane-associated phospholipid phosphatase